MNESGDRQRSHGVSADGLTRLLDACLRTSSELDLGAVLQKIADEACQIARSRSSAVQIFETEKDPVQIVTSGLTLEQGAAAEYPVSPEPSLQLQSGSYGASETQDSEEDRPPAGPWLTVPVSNGREDIARLHVAGKDGDEEFTSEHRTLLLMFASHAGAAIANARAHSQEQRVRAELEEMVRRRTGVPDFVSHQLRTSLTSIKGSAATVLGSPFPLNAGETRRFVRTIDEHADHMRHLIGNLADLRDMETGTLSVDPEPTNLEDLVEQAREAFLRRGGGNTLLIDPSPELPMVMADRERIFRVLSMLLADVSENSPPLSVIRVSLSGREADGGVSVEVSTEEGRGRAPDDDPGPFGHLFRSPSQPRAGRGGEDSRALAVCRGIVDAHGGRMSAGGGGPGESLHYSFTLPAGDGENNGADTGPSPSQVFPQRSRRGQARILALDTDPQARSDVRNMLLEAGFIAMVTGDPDSVDHLVGAERPHLVLVDMTLNGGEGFEIAERIGRISDAPVIFMLGNDIGPGMDRAFDLGAADCIRKPFTSAELAARIRAAVRRRRDPVQPEWPEPFVLGELTIDYAQRTATAAGSQVQLTQTEYLMLCELSKAAGRTLTHEQLLRAVWGPLYQGDVRVVRTYIKALRKKLEDDSKHPRFIFTETRVGYRMPRSTGT